MKYIYNNWEISTVFDIFTEDRERMSILQTKYLAVRMVRILVLLRHKICKVKMSLFDIQSSALYIVLPGTPSLFLWKAFRNATINVRRLLIHKYPPQPVSRCSF